MGVGQPPGYPFSLNNAVDALMKKEFDIYRAEHTPHPLMTAYGIAATPFAHKNMDEWRDARTRGVKGFHEPSNFILRGGIDDVWENDQGELHIVDYKATAKASEVTINEEWQGGYKRQIEMYQWMFRKNGFNVSSIGYFVYVNGKMDRKAFDAKLEFDVKILPYEGSDAWVDDALMSAKVCLISSKIPSPGADCEFCDYREAVREVLKPFLKD